MNLSLKILWSAALFAIIAAVVWFVLSPTTGFLYGLGSDTHTGMNFIFLCMPSIFFLLISSTQLMKSFETAAATRQYVWIALSWIYAFGFMAALYFRFLAS